MTETVPRAGDAFRAANEPRIGVIHTSLATVALFGALLKERVPGAQVVNLLDDSILPELGANGGNLAAVEPRWRDYARIVSERGVAVILNACSSIGALCERMQPMVAQPIVRVDAGMARAAVERGRRIGVLATLATTLEPTNRLIGATARAMGCRVEIDAVLAEGAYAALMAGDQAGHDDLVAAALARAAGGNEIVVLAQASMARVLPRLAPEDQARVLTSPTFAADDVAAALARVRAG